MKKVEEIKPASFSVIPREDLPDTTIMYSGFVRYDKQDYMHVRSDRDKQNVLKSLFNYSSAEKFIVVEIKLPINDE